MGLGVSLYLGKQHHPSHAPSVCNVDEVFNCDVVNTSAYAEIAGVPIALIGAAFYAAVLFVSVMARQSPDVHKRAAHLIAAGGILSVGYSVFLGWASAQLGAWCLFCISLYGVNAILLGGGLWAVKESGVSLGAGVSEAALGKSDASFTKMASAAFVVFLASMFWYRSMGDTSGGPAPVTKAADGSVNVSGLVGPVASGVALDGTEPIYGNPAAPYTIVEWADFECPHCGLVAPQLKKLVDAHPEVKVAFRNYPLSNRCNPNVGSSFHEHACDAAAAAECAGKQGKFWELTGLMFMNQSFLDVESIKMMAEQKQLDVAALTACMADPSTELAVRADVDAGEKAGITGTPALFLMGAHGDGVWVKLTAGPEDVPTILDAHKAKGGPLPVTGG